MFTEFDVAVCMVMLTSTIIFLLNGVLKGIVAIAGWGLSVFLTWYLYPAAYGLTRDTFGKDSLIIQVITVFVLFILLLAMISLFASWLVNTVRSGRVGMIDRLAGLLLGAFLGFIIVSVAHYSITVIIGKEPDWVKEGQTYGLTHFGAVTVSDIMKGKGDKYLDGIKEFLNKAQERAGTLREGDSAEGPKNLDQLLDGADDLDPQLDSPITEDEAMEGIQENMGEAGGE